ncbi:helix-turn-helix domain-containing protein [Eikenella corrodens]|uniref:helix-turn-helix domain-containing protein n=1 Tax=Eikenella corrodens TaxID=539 RepID=UPI0012AC5DC4|nr:helix-turn-helix transcriptional regulator [Eikenella corrodens]
MNKIKDYELISAQEEAKVDFAIMLNNILDEKNISLSDLAKLTGSSSSLISRIMSGSENLTIETMVSMLFALNEKIAITKQVSKNYTTP